GPGRQRALEWFTNLIDDVRALHEMVGHPVVRWVEVHSAPSRKADAKALASSLAELSDLFEDAGLVIVVEHCDAAGGVGPGEKEFLSLDDEITAVVDTRVHLTINWGRSVVESHDPGRPARRNDEPTSLLTTDLVGSFLDAARGLQAYQGIKIQTPADATVERRLAMITSIHDVMATA
ncbi:DUF4862 family protein, partial [Xanthomonas citri pv. citri]|nr:DUF4862 family protein [Xanthomonas citri pv. citri]